MSALAGRVIVGMGVGRFFPIGTRHLIGSGKLTMCTVGFGNVYSRSTRELLGTFAFHQGINRFGDILHTFRESLRDELGDNVDIPDISLEMLAVLSARNTLISANESLPEFEDTCSTLALGSGCAQAFGMDLSEITGLSNRKGFFWREVGVNVDAKGVATFEEM